MSEDDWKPLCDRIKRLEMKFCEQNPIIDEETERFVISLDSSSYSECELGTSTGADMRNIKIFLD